MITTALIVVGFVLLVAAMVVLVLNLSRAPEGVEDEAGFHYVKEPVVENSRYYAARSLRTKRTKTANPLKAHIPAA